MEGIYRLIIILVFSAFLYPHGVDAQKASSVGENLLQDDQSYEVIVEKGNTLYSIAKVHGLSVDQLKQLNGLTNNNIYPGQRLRIDPTLKKTINPSSIIHPATPSRDSVLTPPVIVESSPPANVPLVQRYQEPTLSLTTLASDITTMFNRQMGKLHKRIIVTYLSEPDLTQEKILSYIHKLGKDSDAKDLLIIYMTHPEMYECEALLPLLNSMKSIKFLVLDFANNCNIDVEQIREWQKNYSLNIVVSHHVDPQAGYFWEKGMVFQAIKEGLSGAADFNRDLLVNVPELSFYLSDRVYQITNQQQQSFIPFFPGDLTPLVRIE